MTLGLASHAKQTKLGLGKKESLAFCEQVTKGLAKEFTGNLIDRCISVSFSFGSCPLWVLLKLLFSFFYWQLQHPLPQPTGRAITLCLLCCVFRSVLCG